MKLIDGYRCYGLLSPLEQIKWNKAITKSKNKTPSSYILQNKYWTFQDFIRSSFIWNQTEDGFDYWEEISNKYIIHDLLYVQPRWRDNVGFVIFKKNGF